MAPSDDTDLKDSLITDEKRYSGYYNDLYPLLKEGKLNFQRIAEKTAFRERRVREGLLFRLSSGEVMQLFGRKAGWCYICDLPMTNRKEPMCLLCIQSISLVAHELYSSASTQEEDLDPSMPQLIKHTTDAHSSISFEITSPDDQMQVSRQLYDAMCTELSDYRQTYGPIAKSLASSDGAFQDTLPSLPASAALVGESAEPAPLSNPWDSDEVGVLPSEPSEEPASPATASADILSDVLQTLDCSAGEDALETLSLETDVSPGQEDVPLRHYGFQRLNISRGVETL